MRASLFAPWLALALVACAEIPKIGTQCNPRSPRGLPESDAPLVSFVEISISNMTQRDTEDFRAHFFAGDVENVVLKSFQGGTAVYEIEYHGCECELPGLIARIPTPGLKYQGRVTKLAYSAFDNQPPRLTFFFPEREDVRLISDVAQLVALEAKDLDVAEVTVNGVIAERFRADVFLARIRLMEGPNQVVAYARDGAGNETTTKIRVVAAGAPPADPAAWRTIDGKATPGSILMVERREFPVDAKGHYRAVVPLQKGQRQIEIVEILPDGRKSVSVKEIH